MDIETTAKAMQYILAPVVMISTCAIILGQFHSRYSNVNKYLHSRLYESTAAIAAANACRSQATS